MAVQKYRDENGRWVEICYSGGNNFIDGEMSSTSENAVQNKVVKAYVDGLIGDIDSILDTINGEAI